MQKTKKTAPRSPETTERSQVDTVASPVSGHMSATERNRAARSIAPAGICCAIGCWAKVPKGTAWCKVHA